MFREQTVICQTQGSDAVPYFRVALTQAYVDELLRLRQARGVLEAAGFGERLRAVSMWHEAGAWGFEQLSPADGADSRAGLIALADPDAWWAEAGLVSLVERSRDDYSIHLLETGVVWEVYIGHGPGWLGTPILSWADLEAVAAGGSPFVPLQACDGCGAIFPATELRLDRDTDGRGSCPNCGDDLPRLAETYRMP